MSFVGGDYEYDVFFSYAWAEEATHDTALRDWTRMVADKIKTMLSQRFNGTGRDFSPYLDRDVNNLSGAELDSRLKAAVENSAVFVALVSSFYNSAYCTDELTWFLDKVKSDGSLLGDRLCLFVVQQVPDSHWPPRLREATGTRLLYKEFCGKHGQPFDMSAFLNGGPTPNLIQPIEGAVMDIAAKVSALRDNVVARESYEKSQRLPTRAVVFLEAEGKDKDRWAEHRQKLKEHENIILPPTAPVAANEMPDPNDVYAGCDGIVLLRSRADDNIATRLKRAYLDRRQIVREKKPNVPWALLDELDEPPPEGEEYEIPRVVPRGEWVQDLQRKLRDC